MKPNKTSHYRDEKLYHYHGNREAHSQRAGWVTREEKGGGEKDGERRTGSRRFVKKNL